MLLVQEDGWTWRSRIDTQTKSSWTQRPRVEFSWNWYVTLEDWGGVGSSMQSLGLVVGQKSYLAEAMKKEKLWKNSAKCKCSLLVIAGIVTYLICMYCWMCQALFYSSGIQEWTTLAKSLLSLNVSGKEQEWSRQFKMILTMQAL